MYSSLIIFVVILPVALSVLAQDFQEDIHATGKGALKITFIGHGTLMFAFNKMIIHVDPVTSYADYSRMPKADLILVTHHHGDHLDPAAIQTLTKANTKLLLTEKCLERSGIKDGLVIRNGDSRTIKGITIEGIPAYNLKHMRSSGAPYHSKGEGNGYILTFGERRVYVDTPEMKSLQDIDIAFLPMNLPYTMTPEMVAEAAKSFRPRILYPYHYGNTDTSKIENLLKDSPEIEVRVREMR
jgi:L-ascorbate metabolism protein UlaG (beta-lactamase superfamily)